MKAMCCTFTVRATGERTSMILRAHLVPMDALQHCVKLGMLPRDAGDFTCWHIPDESVELFTEHAEKLLSESKAQELFGDKWRAGEQP